MCIQRPWRKKDKGDDPFLVGPIYQRPVCQVACSDLLASSAEDPVAGPRAMLGVDASLRIVAVALALPQGCKENRHKYRSGAGPEASRC
jgi:hypothetical protein